MGLKVLSAIFAILGYILMWFALFGKKEKIDDMYLGRASSLFDLIFNLLYKISQTLIKRILLFLLGLFTAFMFTMGVIFA